MKIYKNLFILFLLISSNITLAKSSETWVFFDLGNTIVNIDRHGQVNYFSQTKSYLKKLKDAGLKLGLITNIPERWGKKYVQKLATLKKFIKDNWVGSEKFSWEDFDAILLPPNDHLQKPNPFLFNKAKALTSSCKIYFQGEDEIEVKTAATLGFHSHLIKSKNSFYMNESDIINNTCN